MTKHHILAGRMHVCMRSNGALGDIVFKGARAEGPLTYGFMRLRVMARGHECL